MVSVALILSLFHKGLRLLFLIVRDHIMMITMRTVIAITRIAV